MKSNLYKIDASHKSLGRLAAEIAIILQGKNQPSYLPYQASANKVQVQNISQIRLTGKKEEQKKYFHFSGYPGGIRMTSMKELKKDNPALLLRMTVRGMLANTKLRNNMMKRLIIE